MGLSISEKLQSIRSFGKFAEEKAEAFLPLEFLLSHDKSQGDERWHEFLNNGEPDDSAFSTLTDIYYNFVWKKIEPILFSVAQRTGVKVISRPKIVTAATGDFNALALADDFGEYAIVLDTHLHAFSTAAMNHCVRLMFNDGDEGLSLRFPMDERNGPPAGLKELPDYDSHTAEIARILGLSILEPDELKHELARLAVSWNWQTGGLANVATMGFATFILAHEYGHIACGHHAQLDTLKRSGASPEEISDFFCAAEFQADQFAAYVMLAIVFDDIEDVFIEASDETASVFCKLVFMFGAVNFLALLHAREKITGAIKTMAILKAACSKEDAKSFLRKNIRKASSTHPETLTRNARVMDVMNINMWTWVMRAAFNIALSAADQVGEHLLLNISNQAMLSLKLTEDIFSKFHLSEE